MRKEETHTICVEITCDACGCVQDPRNPHIYWAQQITSCSYHIPPDGKNHGTWKGDLCQLCREKVHGAIEAVIQRIKGGL